METPPAQGRPPPCEQTNTYENITFPHTSYAVGNNRFYWAKWAHSYLLFRQVLHGLKSLMTGCVPIFAIVWAEKLVQ